MTDPVLGELSYNDDLGGFVSAPRGLPCLRGHEVVFVIGAAEDERPGGSVLAAIRTLLHAGPELLESADAR